MSNSNHLLEQAQREIEALSKTSQTAAGQAEPAAKATDGHIDALNEVFALFRINYHNQYYKAYSDSTVLAQIKKLWLESLVRFEPETIRRGAREVIETSDYLPTLHRMIAACQGSLSKHGLKEPHAAYIEACHAPSPKAAHRWSHPAVYYAGKASDWYFLASSSERAAYPVFAQHYKRLCEQVINGIRLPQPNAPALPENIETPLSREENQRRLEALRSELDL
ncbi:hypothetical protein QWI17_16110 [Gilvimarinus sp. SDUM040013]|uniref:Replication protein P n=1 Tax=Gilvimarinus gilvus TaxID=3058038 RepID=A0ABU4S1W1_9GAMM|nr:replication protein P [Gilvimarinus sp. SDUM040013]MDO3387366.1 hypothetical protein [Gilvimarinus sp. SDUM040013]MDX6849843.1 replication protein P [Gilvimarinus sp. SDUM040013]